MKKAVEKVNKHNFNGRPLKVKEVGYSMKNKGQQKTHRCYLWISYSHVFILFVRTLMVWLLREKSTSLKAEALQGAMVEWEQWVEWVEWIAWTWIAWALDQMAQWSIFLQAWWTTPTSPMRSSMVSRLAGLAAPSLWLMWGLHIYPIVFCFFYTKNQFIETRKEQQVHLRNCSQ